MKKFWPLMHEDTVFMQYLPDPTPDGRLPEREYFWNVLNTLQNKYVQHLSSTPTPSVTLCKKIRTVKLSRSRRTGGSS